MDNMDEDLKGFRTLPINFGYDTEVRPPCRRLLNCCFQFPISVITLRLVLPTALSATILAWCLCR